MTVEGVVSRSARLAEGSGADRPSPPQRSSDRGTSHRSLPFVELREQLAGSPVATLAGAICVILMLGVLDWATGPDVAFSVFYLVPVAAVAWTSGRNQWIATSAGAASTWLAADLAAGTTYSTPLIPVWNVATRFTVFGIVATLLSRLHGAMEREQELARFDAMTGVANGRWFSEQAASAVAGAGADDVLTLMYLDLDDFKSINDRLGHSAGDQVLREVGAALRGAVRSDDPVGRLGGDEFGVVLVRERGTDLERETAAIAERVSAALAQIDPPVSFSAGASSFCPPPRSIDIAIDAADSLMYEVKRNGKHGFAHQSFSGSGGPATGATPPPSKRA